MAKKKTDKDEDSIQQQVGGIISPAVFKKYSQYNAFNQFDDLAQDYKNHISISTGSIRLDQALGSPYTPGIHHISGHKGSFKSTFALHMMNECKKKYGDYVGLHYFPLQAQAITPSMIEKFSHLQLKDIGIWQPDYGQMAVDIIADIVQTSKRLMIVVDSVPAIIPLAIIQQPSAKAQVAMGKHAKLISILLQKINMPSIKNECILFFLNQKRDSLNPYQAQKLPGGRAFEHYQLTHLILKSLKSKLRKRMINGKDTFIGSDIDVLVDKTRNSVPYSNISIPMLFGQGIDKVAELIQLAKEIDIIQRKGVWYSYKDHRTQGQWGLYELFAQSPQLYAQMQKQVLELIL